MGGVTKKKVQFEMTSAEFKLIYKEVKETKESMVYPKASA